jgi:hypothetical protein
LDKEENKMNEKSLKKIYEFLELDLLEKFEYPCDNCGYFECEKNTLNSGDVIKKRYKWNDINWRYCLKGKKERLMDLMEILRLEDFKKKSHEKCVICKKKFFKHDMVLQTETEGRDKSLKSKKEKKFYELKLFSLCKPCNRSYVHRKKPVYKGFSKFK